MEPTPQGGVHGAPRDTYSTSILGTSCECPKMRRGIMRARQQVRVPTWRDALSWQSSELPVAKANEAVALGNAKVGVPRSEHNTFAEDSNVANDSSVCALKVSNLCSVCSAVRDALSGQSSELSAAKAGKVLPLARRSLGNQAEQEGVLRLG